MDMVVKVGDNVLYGKYDGSEVEYDGLTHQLIRDDDVLLTYEGKDLDLESAIPTKDNVLIKLPVREQTTVAGLVVSTSTDTSDISMRPDYGEVIKVEETNGPKELNLENKKMTKVSVFMNVFDCHVNRSPCAGIVSEIKYMPGKFINASLDKASEDNERCYYKVKNSFDEDIIVVQIAGLIARRIVCEVEQGQELKQGDRIGMIRFGSRVDIYFKNKKVLAKLGQNVVAGESLLASE